MHWHENGGWWVMFPIFWLLVLVAIGFLVAAIARGRFPSPRPPESGDSALEILRRRFASGEIDADEYQRRRELLSP